MFYESTNFNDACFLRNQSADETWKFIRKLWMMIYMELPDYLAVDQGFAYTFREMKSIVEAASIKLEEEPIEKHRSMGIKERYHAPYATLVSKNDSPRKILILRILICCKSPCIPRTQRSTKRIFDWSSVYLNHYPTGPETRGPDVDRRSEGTIINKVGSSTGTDRPENKLCPRMYCFNKRKRDLIRPTRLTIWCSSTCI